jgi:hypothetical protein
MVIRDAARCCTIYHNAMRLCTSRMIAHSSMHFSCVWLTTSAVVLSAWLCSSTRIALRLPLAFNLLEFANITDLHGSVSHAAVLMMVW